MKWCFEHTGFRSGQFNMQHDEQIARRVAEGTRLPTVRVFGWDPPAISLGWNQALEEIDAEAAAQAGIDVVRRPTGGRAILHSDELTYSVAMPADGKSVSAVHYEISQALLFGLHYVGIDAMLEQTQPHFPSLYRSQSSVTCFTSSARHEIKVQGRKLVGSAQRRFFFCGTEVVLQHGSILLGPDHQRIVDFLALNSEEERIALRKELGEKTIDCKSIFGSSIEFDDVAEAIRKGFEQSWGISFDTVSSPTLSTVFQS